MSPSSKRRSREAAFGELAERLGLEYLPKADKDYRQAWSVLPELPKSGDIRHVMYGDLDGTPVTAFRHRYVVSTGQSANVVIHWVFSTDVPSWPTVHVRRRSWLARAVGIKSGVSSDATLDKEWVIKADDAAFADTLLGRQARELLTRQAMGDRRERSRRWHVIENKLCLVSRSNLKPDHVEAAFRALIEMLGAVSRSSATAG